MRRESWGLECPTVLIPRTGDEADKPAQITNDLIVNAGVWRNGGCNEETHLCDDCLRVGLRHIKLKVDACLEEIEADTDKDAELAALTQKLGRTQFDLQNLQHDHDRMQDRLSNLVELVEKHEIDGGELLKSCKWEVRRGPSRG
jgi:hypothetical protein